MTTRDVPITVIGGGLAGCEAAWQLLRRGHRIRLCEMKPERFSPAHKSPLLAELVCSNSLRSNTLDNAVGLLKEELRRMDSLIMAAADATAVPAGKALAVDRTAFSRFIEERLDAQPDMELIRGEISEIPATGVTIVATGPLTSDAFAGAIASLTGSAYLYFYDAISPIVEGESIDKNRVFAASRYDRGEADYLNCPLDQEAYENFWKALKEAEEVPLHTFEEVKCFEGCLPVEVIARRGIETLAHGPMKPVGLIDPRTGRQPHAVVQLRREDKSGILYNIVGFQTKLTWSGTETDLPDDSRPGKRRVRPVWKRPPEHLSQCPRPAHPIPSAPHPAGTLLRGANHRRGGLHRIHGDGPSCGHQRGKLA